MRNINKLKHILDFIPSNKKCFEYFNNSCVTCLLRDQCKDIYTGLDYPDTYLKKEEVVKLFIKDRVLVEY